MLISTVMDAVGGLVRVLIDPCLAHEHLELGDFLQFGALLNLSL